VNLRIDYLSPLPPVRSGIADYSVDLLPHLAAGADVRVLALPGQPVGEEVAARFAVSEPAALAGEGGRVPLYQMGNNLYHEPVWELAMARPGVVVLHDLVLHHFLLNRTTGRGDWESYRAELERCHGWIGDAASRPVRWGAHGRAVQFELPASRTLVRRNRGVVVHGGWAAELLREEDPRLAVRVVPMAIPLPAAATRAEGAAFRREHGLPENAPLLGSFGFQTPIKRTEVAIRALARQELASAHLLVAGELSIYSNFGDLAAELGVGDRVHVTGFLPFAELGRAIAACDLCLNLRYPSAGETSASLLRILAVGRPVVVSEYAEFGELPETIALRVPLGDDEEERFAAGVASLIATPDALAAMGERARRYVAERHDPARAAAAMLAAVAELAPLEPPGDAPPAVAPRSSLVDATSAGEIRVEGLEGWQPGERRRLEVTVENRGRAFWRPSADVSGGIQIEVVFRTEREDLWRGRPWLSFQGPVSPGESVRFAFEARRPFARARLRLQPMIALGGRHVPYSDWRFERWL
jgi:glycosyltransferase involved in cell wall biosynthesis